MFTQTADAIKVLSHVCMNIKNHEKAGLATMDMVVLPAKYSACKLGIRCMPGLARVIPEPLK